ncbi:DUF6328 family protein [Kineococcus sp. NPDC059986]|uniref:DUF6328 family protein n=1 Tax=Kineococcus sp. NPDC059986 TaxID=3155538 RepID=UPI00344B60CD
MTTGAQDPEDPYRGLRRETPTERLDRNWVELLQELRVVQTGVQLLTGFLLTLPFQSRFEDLDRYQESVYLVVLLLAVTAVVLFIAPVGYHRALFQQRSKAQLVRAGSAFAKAGLATVGLVVSGGVSLVVDVVGGRVAGWVAGGAVAALVLVCWYVLPRRTLAVVLRDRAAAQDSADASSGTSRETP